MKLYKLTSLMALAVLTACSSEEITSPDGNCELRLTSTIENTRVSTADSGTQSKRLYPGETVKVWVDDATTDNVLYEANTLVADYSGNLSGGSSMFFPATGNNVNIYAIHGAQFSETTLPDSFTHAVPTDQSEMGTTYTNADLLFAAEKNVKRIANPTTCNLNFYHMLSKVEVAIVSGNGDPMLALTGGLALNNVYTQCTVAFDKDADLTVRNNRCDLIRGVDVLGSIKMTDVMNTDFSDGRIIYNEALVVPQVVESAELVFTLAEGGVLKYKLPTGMEFESGKKYRFQITLNLTGVEVTSTITDWECDDVITGDGEAEIIDEALQPYAPYTLLGEESIVTIRDNRNYVIKGNFTGSVTVMANAHPTLILRDAQITTDGAVMLMANAELDMLLIGESTINASQYAVRTLTGSILTIDGIDGTGKLTVQANEPADVALIGGQAFYTISLRNAMFNIYKAKDSYSAGIGLDGYEASKGTPSYRGGTINIYKSVFNAVGGYAPVIGAGRVNRGSATVNEINITLKEGQEYTYFFGWEVSGEDCIGGAGVYESGSSTCKAFNWYDSNGNLMDLSQAPL